MGAHSLGRGHASVKGLIHAMNSTSISISDSFFAYICPQFSGHEGIWVDNAEDAQVSISCLPSSLYHHNFS